MRARRREINIFNMSLLDILCGALGAFCFMMLVALPYYIPPGSGLELRKAQEETARLLLAIEKMKERLPDQKSVEEMEKLMRDLEAQIKALQGKVNILTAENAELKEKAARLTNENEQLRAQVEQLTNDKATLQQEVTQLTAEKEQLAGQNQLLQAQKQDLEKENGNLKAQLAQKVPLVLMARAEDEAQSIDLVTMTKAQVEKFPSAIFQNWVAGQFDLISELRLALLRARGIAFGVMSDRPPGAELKLYVRLTSPEPIRRSTEVQCALFGDIRVDPPQKLGRVTLRPDRLWALVGTLSIDKNSRPSFQEATAEEREAEWFKLTNSTPTPPPTPTPTPTDAERAAEVKQRADYEARRLKLQETRKKFTKLMRIPLDESGKNDAEVLQLTEEILKDLPPRDFMYREVQSRRDRVLEMKARREGGTPPPNNKLSPPPAPAPSPKS